MATPESPAKAFVPLAYLAFVAAAGLLVYSFVTVAREGETRRRCSAMCLLHPNYAAANRRAPSFALKNMRGETISLDAYRGKVVVLNFWTRTCGPCLREMPEIADLARILKDRPDTAVLTVSTDDGPEDVRDVLKAVLKDDPPFDVLFDPDSKVVGGKYGTHLFPETWIIDKRGVLRARFDGARAWGNAAVVELVDDLRHDGYCPIEVKESHPVGEGAKVCEEMGT